MRAAAVAILGLICALPVTAQMRAFKGATIIDGNGGKPIANGVLLIATSERACSRLGASRVAGTLAAMSFCGGGGAIF